MQEPPPDVPAPVVTIVTPTFNRAAMLEQTLRSLRAQTFRRFEHIVVDGGSTDGTLELLRRYEGTYPMRWVSEPDDGMYSAINKGLRMGRGDIAAYLNSDDLYFPWALDAVVETFRSHREADVVFGDVMNVNEDEGWHQLAWNLPYDLDYLRRAGLMWQPGVFWRRSVMLDAGGFDESVRYGADLECWLRLGAAGNTFHKLNEFLAVVRLHRETLSLVHRPRVVEELEEIRAKHAPERRAGPLRDIVDRLRRPVWTRLYWLRLVAESVVPRRFRQGPWSRFLGPGGVTICYVSLLFRPIPGLGRRIGGPLLRPGRDWLQPSA